jgi:hypothetical protein
MCLIVDQHKNTPLTDEELRSVYRKNSDGMGAVYTERGRLKAWRYVPKNADDAIAAYRVTLDRADDRVVWHWRFATHGVVSVAMSHPFGLPFGAYLLHNGVLGAWGNRAASGESDTACLARHIAAIATHASTYDDPRFRAWLAREVQGSAVLIVRRSPDDGRMVVDRYGNEGIHHADRWLSNTYAGPSSLYPPPVWTPRQWSPPSSGLRLDRPGIPWGPGTVAELASTIAATGWHGKWALESDDVDVVRWGIGEWCSEQSADGLTVAVRECHGGRVMLTVSGDAWVAWVNRRRQLARSSWAWGD